MVGHGLAAVAIHGFDVAGACPPLSLWRSADGSADGTREVTDLRALPPALARSMVHGRSQYSTAHACKMSCVVIKCVIWCRCVLNDVSL